MLINGKTKTVALIGDPVEHSFSPFIHNYGFEMHKLNMIYVNHNVKKTDLRNAIYGIKALGYIGANITYPYKIEVMGYLDQISQEASLIGAVNTIKNEDGKLVGFNTDGLGFIYGLKQRGVEIKDKTICLLGAGGAARSIAISLCLNYPCNIIICNRNIIKAEEISCIINNSDENFKGQVIETIGPKDLILENVDILINCTPVGMGVLEDQIPFEGQLKLHNKIILCDLIYHPYETKLMKKAKDTGCRTFNGLDMLVGQGILAFEIWTGHILEFEAIKKNIVQRIYV